MATQRRKVVTDESAKPKAPAKRKTTAKAAAKAPAKPKAPTAQELAAKKEHDDNVAVHEQAVKDAQTRVDEVTLKLNDATDEETKTQLTQELQSANEALTGAQAKLAEINTPPKVEGVEQEGLVNVNIPRAFTLTEQNGSKVSFVPGPGKMTKAQAEHWWSKNNGVTIVD